MWGAGRPAARWAGPDVALPASGCGTERRAGCCDGRGGADPLGSAGRHKHEDVYGGLRTEDVDPITVQVVKPTEAM